MKTLLAVLVASFALCAHQSVALEVTTGGDANRSENASLMTRIGVLEATMAAAINGLTDRIKACSSQKKLYNPGGAGADANGCVNIDAGDGSEPPIPPVVTTYSSSTGKNVRHDFCALSYESFQTSAKNGYVYSHGAVRNGDGTWTVRCSGYSVSCGMSCIDFPIRLAAGGSGKSNIDCSSAGGTYNAALGACTFSGSACPSGWVSFRDYHTTNGSLCYANNSPSCPASSGSDRCTPASNRTFSAMPPATCEYNSQTAFFRDEMVDVCKGSGPFKTCSKQKKSVFDHCESSKQTCTATIDQVACY